MRGSNSATDLGEKAWDIIFRFRVCSRNGKEFARYNAMPWFSYLAFDIIGDLAFGSPFGTDLGEKAWDIIFRFRVCSARSRTLNMPGVRATKAPDRGFSAATQWEGICSIQRDALVQLPCL
jgi:hypothetical protein